MMHMDATARRVYSRQRAKGANRWDAALVALNPNPNGPVMQADHATRRAADFALDRFEDFCDLVDHAVLFPAEKHVGPHLENARDRLNLWRIHRARRSIRRQVVTLESYAHAERVRLVTAWAALEDALAAQLAEPEPDAPGSPVGDVLRALRTVETGRARALPMQNPSLRDPGPAELERNYAALLDCMTFYWDIRDRQTAARTFRRAVAFRFGEQAADPVTVLYNLH